MRPLVFKPSDIEALFLEDNKISWSEYCHDNLRRDMGNQKYANTDKLQMPIVMMLVGLLILLIAISNLFNSYILLTCYGMSIFSLSFGIFSFIGGLKRG
jgi:hypothetical protein